MLESVYTPQIGREVLLRSEGSDRQVWADTFTGLYHVPPTMTEPLTVLDLGANIGLTAAHYQVMWPDADIVAIEMDEESAQLARRNAPDAEVHSFAVTANGGWGSYNPNVLAEAFSFTPGDSAGKVVASYTMRQTILRYCASKRRSPRRGVDFVKMDIEGAEWPIFKRDNWQRLVSHLLVELHDNPMEPGMDSAEMVVSACNQLAQHFDHVAHCPPHPRAVFAWH